MYFHDHELDEFRFKYSRQRGFWLDFWWMPMIIFFTHWELTLSQKWQTDWWPTAVHGED